MGKISNNQEHRERLFLLDGYALAYRAYYSFISRPLITSKGEHTSAIFGFVNALMKILDEEKPDHIAVVFDRPEPTFRHKMFEPYKATRQKMPEDMVSQLGRLREVVEAFNVPILEMAGYEADDIMGTLAYKAEKENLEIYLVTSDKDFMQLISPLTKIYKPGKSGDEWEIVDFEHVEEKFGVTPDKVVDVLGLTGDKSDNVPGVPGIGEVTAIPLVREFGSMENIYTNIEKISKESVKTKLLNNKEQAFLSKHLVTIKTDVPIDVDIHQLKAQQKDIVKLTHLFTELEFKYLIRKLTSTEEKFSQINISEEEISKFISDITTDQHQYHLITTEKELKDFIKKLKASNFFVFDTETTSKDPMKAELVGLSFSLKSKEAYFIPVQTDTSDKIESFIPLVISESQKSLFDSHSSFTEITERNRTTDPGKIGKHRTSAPAGFDCGHVLKLLSNIFADESISKCGQNIKYDLLVLENCGIQVKGVAFDTMVANYILRPDGRHNLDDMAMQHLSYKTITFDELLQSEKDIRNVPLGNLANYSSEDADITFRLYEILHSKLNRDKLDKLCEEIEFPLISVLAGMEFAGVKIDVNILNDMSKELERLNDNLVNDIFNLAGKKFNVNSTQQLSKILFEDLKLPTAKKTKTGFSTDVGVLEDLRHSHAIVEKLLDYRTYTKLKSTYVDALATLINPKTGRVHTSFNQTIATTGRLSSSNPNLQNIPIRTEMGRAIRKAFVPQSSDWLILSADYSQIELRVMAHISGDPGLSEAFKNGEDIHTTTAAKIFGVDLKNVNNDMRRKAKEVNFGIMYGLGPYGLANRLEISQSEAKDIIEKYHQRFPKVKMYIEDTIAKARRDGYVETLLGRRRYLPEIKSRNQNIRGNAERQAINMPIQGTAADMIKLAMIKLHEVIATKYNNIKMLLQVHDELVFEVHKYYMDKAKLLVADKMKSALPLNVPLEVEIGVGKNWFEAH
jgi:DNA polymerase-1